MNLTRLPRVPYGTPITAQQLDAVTRRLNAVASTNITGAATTSGPGGSSINLPSHQMPGFWAKITRPEGGDKGRTGVIENKIWYGDDNTTADQYQWQEVYAKQVEDSNAITWELVENGRQSHAIDDPDNPGYHFIIDPAVEVNASHAVPLDSIVWLWESTYSTIITTYDSEDKPIKNESRLYLFRNPVASQLALVECTTDYVPREAEFIRCLFSDEPEDDEGNGVYRDVYFAGGPAGTLISGPFGLGFARGPDTVNGSYGGTMAYATYSQRRQRWEFVTGQFNTLVECTVAAPYGEAHIVSPPSGTVGSSFGTAGVFEVDDKIDSVTVWTYRNVFAFQVYGQTSITKTDFSQITGSDTSYTVSWPRVAQIGFSSGYLVHVVASDRTIDYWVFVPQTVSDDPVTLVVTGSEGENSPPPLNGDGNPFPVSPFTVPGEDGFINTYSSGSAYPWIFNYDSEMLESVNRAHVSLTIDSGGANTNGVAGLFTSATQPVFYLWAYKWDDVGHTTRSFSPRPLTLFPHHLYTTGYQIHVTWNSVPDADGYVIHAMEALSSWECWIDAIIYGNETYTFSGNETGVSEIDVSKTSPDVSPVQVVNWAFPPLEKDRKLFGNFVRQENRIHAVGIGQMHVFAVVVETGGCPDAPVDEEGQLGGLSSRCVCELLLFDNTARAFPSDPEVGLGKWARSGRFVTAWNPFIVSRASPTGIFRDTIVELRYDGFSFGGKDLATIPGDTAPSHSSMYTIVGVMTWIWRQH